MKVGVRLLVFLSLYKALFNYGIVTNYLLTELDSLENLNLITI